MWQKMMTVFFLLLLPFTAEAGGRISESLDGKTVQITLYDAITQEDANAITKKIELFSSVPNPPVYTFSLNSPGGDVNAAIAIGRLARKTKSMVMVDDESECLSSCVLILAGGAYRITSGRVGIHRPYDPIGIDGSEKAVKKMYEKLSVEVLRYLEEVHVDKSLYDSMMRVSPDKIKYLTEAELEGYGLSSNDPYIEEAADIRAAQRLGISRAEYAKRNQEKYVKCGYPPPIAESTEEEWLSIYQCYDEVMAGKVYLLPISK